MSETGKRFANVLIVISVIVLIGCGIAFLNSEQDYVIAKGNDAYYSFLGSPSEANDAKDTLDGITAQRTIYIAAMVIAFVVLLSSIYVRSSSKKINIFKSKTSSVDKLKELEELKNSNLITQEEFTEKRNSILRNI